MLPFVLVRELLADHREYGANKGGEIGQLPGPTIGTSKPALVWMSEVQKLFDPQRVLKLHGRLLILGLAHLEPPLAEYLEAQDSFLSALRSELKEQFESLLLPQPKSETPAAGSPVEAPPAPQPINDPTPLHLDSPAVDDRLGRRGFARALAIRLERIWREMNPEHRPADRPVPQGSFVLHLHGPWGSGKSSVLEMLRGELRPRGQPTAPTVASPWVVVDFNAWQNQRLDPPWWPLLDGIIRQSARQVSWGRRIWLRVREGLWRFTTKRRDLLIFTFVALTVGVLGYLFLRPTIVAQLEKPLGEAGEVAEKVTDILGLLTLVGGWLWFGSRSLISGSARAAQSFLDSAADPMDRIQRHFQNMVGTVDRPIAVFVDDLDRCQASYVVQLLEGIQTLFRDPRVVYVIAADQRWLHACFEKTYEAFAESVREPGRRLGSLFLEKAFEISVSLPELSPGVREEYWRFLLGGDPVQAKQRLAALEQEARAEFRHDRSEGEVVARLDQSQGAAEADDPLRTQARRQIAVERLASAAVEQSVSYFLQPFAPLLEPNPRSMKRLLNAYAIRRDLAILSGLDVLAHEGRRKKLALWTILALRWPALEDFLREKAGGDDSAPGTDVAALLSSREVAEVVEGRNLGGPLTLDDLKELLGFGAVAANKTA
ncbi:MAG TPA: P-loop NTPase fold protein [Thermoanaerobaculia bacterium]|nr:P-loop NTPase fold protein [Thermoanaerobaculia bacterium]